MQSAGPPQKKRGLGKDSFSGSKSSSDHAPRSPFKGALPAAMRFIDALAFRAHTMMSNFPAIINYGYSASAYGTMEVLLCK